jgi:membrane protein implicated in regulation of membrane protease activity
VAATLPGAAGSALAAGAKAAFVDAMSVTLVTAAVVAVAAAVMVRRFYPDRLVMQGHGAHGPVPQPQPELEPGRVAEAAPATDGNGRVPAGDVPAGDVPAGELRPSGELEGVGER